MKGYLTPSGYMGYVPNLGYILFCTEIEYFEYYSEYYSEYYKTYAETLQ